MPNGPNFRARVAWQKRSRGRAPWLAWPLALLIFLVLALQQNGLLDVDAILRLPEAPSVLYGVLGLSALLLLSGLALWSGFALRAWHAFANNFFVGKPIPVRAPWVIDGDTIDDRATGVRFRLANIDAPETGDNARCFHENRRGEMATTAAIRLVRSAEAVSVRMTFRHDIYGRRVAFVLVDGQDLGEMLVAQGLAVPWQGRRKRWCGRSGGLAKIALKGAFPHSCGACRAQR